MSYQALAAVYDALTQNIDYAARAEYIGQTFRQYNVEGIVLDAGCGTGTLTLLLASLGYNMIGVDISQDMLSLAMQKAVQDPCEITFLNQDLAGLDLFGTVRGIVCMQDTLNHIPPKDLEAVFYRFSLFLERDGLFLFDVNTPHKHRTVLSDNCFVYELRDSFCVWQNEYDAIQGRVLISVDVFERQKHLYSRLTDNFYEFDIPPCRIDELLRSNGFELLAKADGETYGFVEEESQRIIYTARKVS